MWRTISDHVTHDPGINYAYDIWRDIGLCPQRIRFIQDMHDINDSVLIHHLWWYVGSSAFISTCLPMKCDFRRREPIMSWNSLLTIKGIWLRIFIAYVTDFDLPARSQPYAVFGACACLVRVCLLLAFANSLLWNDLYSPCLMTSVLHRL